MLWWCLGRQDGGINLAVFSSGATAVSLCLFREEDLHNGRVTFELPLNARMNRTGDVWHVRLDASASDLLYGGPFFPPFPPLPFSLFLSTSLTSMLCLSRRRLSPRWQKRRGGAPDCCLRRGEGARLWAPLQ